jgi:hypothetical protein
LNRAIAVRLLGSPRRIGSAGVRGRPFVAKYPGQVANDLLLPLPNEIQQQLKDVDEIEIERQRTVVPENSIHMDSRGLDD